jgi:DNA polymerase-3 subunit beta
MDLLIDREELSRGLARIQGIVERRSTHPVLSHVLLHARGDGLRLTATDTEVAFIGDLAANVSKGGELAVDASSLFQIVRNLPDPTVHLLEGQGQRLEIRCGRSFFRLPAVSADEFPPLPAFDSRGTATIDERVLRRLVELVSFSVSVEDGRYGLNGAHIEHLDGRMRMVATDGHRLSAGDADFEGELVVPPRMLVPRKALTIMKKLLGADGGVEVQFGEGAIRLVRPGQTFWFRMLDGEFPDYRAVLPKDCKHRIVVRRNDLSSSLKRVGILVAERMRAVRFAFTETEVEIQVHNVDRGEVTETVPLELEGDPIAVGFNVRYLADILGVLQGEHVQLEIAHPLGPCLVTDPDGSDAFFVVMPMRLD